MTSAIDQWKNAVKAHHTQSIKVQYQASWSSDDIWSSMASKFRDDPFRTDDPVLNRIAQEVNQDSTVLDVGGGAGRYALPLALKTRHVTVAEPSESMVSQLFESAKESDIHNISAVQQSWEEADVCPADLVLCANVVYGVTNIEPFIRRLESHAIEEIILLTHVEPPLSLISPFWKRVHEEERIEQPGLSDLLPVLWEMGIYPNVKMFAAKNPRTVKDRETALPMLRSLLYVKPDTDEEKRLQKAMSELLVETPNGLTLQDAKLQRQALLCWKPN